MNNPKISIIVPVYNTEKYLARCIESITSQTYRNFELIAVNDGSTDNSIELLENIAKKDERVIIINHEKNKGLYHARITGVEHSNGEYIGFVDSDDYISCDYYRTLLEKAEETHSDIVVGRAVHEDENGYRWIHNMYHFIEFGVLEGDDVVSEYWKQEGRNFIWHTIWNKLYSKRIWDKALPHLKKQNKHLIMAEDFAFSSVLYNYAEKLTSVDYGAYFYFQNAAASTSNSGGFGKFAKNIGDLKTAFDFVKDFVGSDNYRINAKKQFKAWSDLYRFFWQGNINNSGLSAKEKKELGQILDDSLPNHGNKIHDPSYFYITTTGYDNRYNDIINAVVSDKFDCISFDIFDTAIVRPFFKPTDLFEIINKEFHKIAPAERRKFSEIRIKAEEIARKEKIYFYNSQKEDITLDDIYEKIGELTSLSRDTLDQLMELEQCFELKFCKARKSVLNIYKAALLTGKRIYFTSDMYLGKDFIVELLNKNGYVEFEDILVSSEENASKRTGSLYEILVKKCVCDAEKIIHIGDNWDCDVVNAKKAGLKPFFYPGATQCIQYNIPDIKSTHSCCPYSEPSGSIVNLEKSLQFLGTRTALVTAANKIYDNPFISFNEWSEINCSPKYLGYYALGMHMLGFTKWFAENAVKNRYDTLAFIARDGYLPMKAYEIVKKYYPGAPVEKYLYTSRKASLVWGVTSADDLYELYDFINPKTCTPDEFAELISPLISEYDRAVAEDEGVDAGAPFNNYETFCSFIKVIDKNFFDKEKCEKYNKKMSAYLLNILKGKTACVDIGYSGRTQDLLYRLTNKHTDAFYIHTNDGNANERKRSSNFEIYSYYDYTPAITGGIREVLISKYGPSCIGYDLDGEVKPIFEEFEFRYPEDFLMNTAQKSCIEFIKDFCDIFGEYLDIMDMRSYDISYPYEFFLSTLTDADAAMFSCLRFEDDMWMGKTVSLTDFWKDCIRYHKIIPFYRQGGERVIFRQDDSDLSYRLFYKNGIDKKGKLQKALFWYAADRDLFKQKLKNLFGIKK